MSDMSNSSDQFAARWPDDGGRDRAGLRVLTLCDKARSNLRVSEGGPVSLRTVHSWVDVQNAISKDHFDVLVLETGSETMIDGAQLSEVRRQAADLHIALVNAEIEEPLARFALRKGVNGVILNHAEDETLDTPLRMVAEGKVYIDSSLAGQLLGEAGPAGSSDQPLISLTDTVALVADDDEYFRMALATILREKFGFAEVFEASNLDQALQMVAGSDRVDLALFDLRMPGMAGASSLHKIRLDNPEIRKMAVVSASQDRNDVLEALAAGTYGFVSKAEGISELKLALSQILKGRIYAPALLHEPPELDPHLEADRHAVVLSFANGEQVNYGCDPEELAESSRYVPEDAGVEDPEMIDIPELSPRQHRVLELLVQGMSNKEIAREMNLGIGTVKVHMTALFAKLGVSNRTSAVAVGAPLL